MPVKRIHATASARVRASQLKRQHEWEQDRAMAAAARSVLDAIKGRAELGDSTCQSLIDDNDAVTIHNLAIELREAAPFSSQDENTHIIF